MGNVYGYLSIPTAALRPRTNPIGPARSARRSGWEKGDGVQIRGCLGILFVTSPFGALCGSAIEREVGDRKGDVGVIDDRRIPRRLSTSQHRIHSELDNPIDIIRTGAETPTIDNATHDEISIWVWAR